MNPSVDHYIDHSDRWPEEIAALRPILLECGLAEELKWWQPCYTHRGKNIVIVQEMMDFLSLMFFKGALLGDPDGALEEQGANTRSARRMRFTSVDDVQRRASTIRAYVEEAKRLEEAGVETAPSADVELVEELQRRLDADPEFRAAFEALTPGRQRGYNIYVAGAKRASTREARVEKCVPRILAGKGLHDR